MIFPPNDRLSSLKPKGGNLIWLTTDFVTATFSLLGKKSGTQKVAGVKLRLCLRFCCSTNHFVRELIQTSRLLLPT